MNRINYRSFNLDTYLGSITDIDALLEQTYQRMQVLETLIDQAYELTADEPEQRGNMEIAVALLKVEVKLMNLIINWTLEARRTTEKEVEP